MDLRSHRSVDIKTVKARRRLKRIAQLTHRLLELKPQGHKLVSHRLQPFRAVMNGIKRRHHSQQHLGRTNVARGFVASNVLLAGLQGQPKRWLAIRIARLAHNPAGHLAAKRIASGKKRGMGAASTHRHTKTLGAANSDVGTELTNRCQQHLGKRVHRHGDKGTAVMGSSDTGGWIPKSPTTTWQLKQNSKNVVTPAERLGLHHLQLHPNR